jgi:tetratricopeptide (TPR) repeat protein
MAQTGTGADQLHTYLMANYHHFSKQWEKALELYKRTLKLNSSTFAYKGFVHFLRDTNNDQLIVELQPIIRESFKDDIDMLSMLAQALANTDHQPQADELFINLNAKDKKNSEIAFHTAQVYIRKKELENALNIINTFLNVATRKPTHFLFHFMKAQIYLQLNNKKEALASIKESLNLHPRFEKGWLLQALLEEKEGRLTEAIKGYENFLDLVGPNQAIAQHLVGLAFKQKIIEQHSTTQTSSHNQLTQSLQLFEQHKYQAALMVLEPYIVQNTTNKEAKMLKIQILTALDHVPQLLKTLKEWILQEPDEPMWYNALHLLYRNGTDIYQIIKTMHEVEKKTPDNILPMLYLADLYIRAQSSHAAQAYLNRALPKTDNQALQASLMLQLGTLYYKNKQYKQLRELYKNYASVATHDAPFLNLMAYYYATKEKNLTTAQQLISQALTYDAHNPHILDTQAIIYYHQYETKKALAILQSIAALEPDDRTITKHLAYTYYQAGDVERAKTTLQHLMTLTNNQTKQKEYQQLLFTWNNKQK